MRLEDNLPQANGEGDAECDEQSTGNPTGPDGGLGEKVHARDAVNDKRFGDKAKRSNQKQPRDLVGKSAD